MKKFLITFAAVAGIVAFALAGADELIPVPLRVTNVYTNGGGNATFTTENTLYGEVQGVILDVSGYATPTVGVTIASTTAGSLGVAQTILSSSNTTDAVYPVCDLKCSTSGVDITGEPAPIYLWNDYVTLTVTNYATNATTDVTAWLIMLK